MIEKIKKTLADSCILFTAFVFILYIAGNLLVSNTITITLATATCLFICCIVLRVFHNILYVKRLHIATRIIIHYLLVLVAAYIGFAFIAKIITNSLASIIMLSTVTLVYSVFAVAIVMTWGKKKEEKNKQKEYLSIFKK